MFSKRNGLIQGVFEARKSFIELNARERALALLGGGAKGISAISTQKGDRSPRPGGGAIS